MNASVQLTPINALLEHDSCNADIGFVPIEIIKTHLVKLRTKNNPVA